MFIDRRVPALTQCALAGVTRDGEMTPVQLESDNVDFGVGDLVVFALLLFNRRERGRVCKSLFQLY